MTVRSLINFESLRVPPEKQKGSLTQYLRYSALDIKLEYLFSLKSSRCIRDRFYVPYFQVDPVSLLQNHSKKWDPCIWGKVRRDLLALWPS